MSSRLIKLSVLALVLIPVLYQLGSPLLWGVLLLVILPLLSIAVFDHFQKRHSIRRNFPLFGRGRWIMEAVRPYVRQYFVESDTDGAPISRMFREIVYRRAKDTLETVPYGARVDVYRTGYEWIGHSLAAIDVSEVDRDLRVMVGGADCRQPYEASVFNVSALSFGALSSNAIRALNLGAKQGGFFHNTGEGGLTQYHLEHGGDLVWQIGTGYYGCRDSDGNFSADAFQEKVAEPAIKMIEVKLSQGAKPGHGGILPAEKNTAETAEIRGVLPGVTVISPSTHSAFHTPLELLNFIVQLRDLSDGKPVGFKLSVGRKSEFVAICKAMVETGIKPDFITVDGGEGGTGAAPLEYVNSVGMPLRDAVAFVSDSLTGFGLKQEVKVIASGKIFTGFHLVKNMALGADICNSGRGMMIALGCVHSLSCNDNQCPTGITTQDPHLVRGLVVSDKATRVASYHRKTIQATADIISSAGLRHTAELNRSHIYRRISQEKIMRYDQIFPYVTERALLQGPIPDSFKLTMEESDMHRFSPDDYLTRFGEECKEISA